MLFSVCRPLEEQETKTALEMVALVVLSHKRHDFASLCHRLVKLLIHDCCLLQQAIFFSLEVSIIAVHDKCVVMILVLQVSDCLLCIIDLALSFPICKDSHQEFTILLQPVIKSASHDRLLLIVSFVDKLPLIPGLLQTIRVGSEEVV